MPKKHQVLNPELLGNEAKRYMAWPDIRTVGVIEQGGNTVHVLDSKNRAMVVIYRNGRKKKQFFTDRSFEFLMSRFSRIVDGRKLLAGRRYQCESRTAKS